MDRRAFLRHAAAAAAGLGVFTRCSPRAQVSPEQGARLDISLAQWSLHRTIRAGELDTLDFPALARDRFGLHAVEYVNTFFSEEARRMAWLRDLKSRADGAGVRNLLIMVDAEGRLGDPEERARRRAVENHHRWVDAAAELGCHSIRVNAASEGSRQEAAVLAADGLARLTDYAATSGLNVIVENHGGYSSDGAWLASVMKLVDHPRCGTLPDFGNFDLGDGRRYDPYRGVAELMPWAKAVSAKSYAFDETGRETTIDFARMIDIVIESGYSGYVGIEYEGSQLPEFEGIEATRDLLRSVIAARQA